jgi:hypothetical protein
MRRGFPAAFSGPGERCLSRAALGSSSITARAAEVHAPKIFTKSVASRRVN